MSWDLSLVGRGLPTRHITVSWQYWHVFFFFFNPVSLKVTQFRTKLDLCTVWYMILIYTCDRPIDRLHVESTSPFDIVLSPKHNGNLTLYQIMTLLSSFYGRETLIVKNTKFVFLFPEYDFKCSVYIRIFNIKRKHLLFQNTSRCVFFLLFHFQYS